jgi:magnesium transporter
MRSEEVNILTWSGAGGPPAPADLEDVLARAQADGFVWIDIVRPSAETMERVARKYELDELAVRQSLAGPQSPRLRVHGSHVFLTWHFWDAKSEQMHELHVFLSKGLLLTVSGTALPETEDTFKELVGGEGSQEPEPAWVLYRILSKSIDAYARIVSSADDAVDQIQNELVANDKPAKDELPKLLAVKKRLARLRSTAAPEREAMWLLAGSGPDVISGDVATYARDLYATLFNLTDEIDTARDIISGSMDLYLSSVSNRLNEIMKRLTAVATIVMPATLITSFWGMNNITGPHLTWMVGTGAFVVCLALIAVTTGALWVYLISQGWW